MTTPQSPRSPPSAVRQDLARRRAKRARELGLDDTMTPLSSRPNRTSLKEGKQTYSDITQDPNFDPEKGLSRCFVGQRTSPKAYKPISVQVGNSLFLSLARKRVIGTGSKPSYSFNQITFSRKTNTGKVYFLVDISETQVSHVIEGLEYLRNEALKLKKQY